MRLLQFDERGGLKLTEDRHDNVPRYAILSHTWGKDEEEVTFDDVENGRGKTKAGYTKLRFCGEQAKKNGLEYFWVDTCCINKANHTELSEAITSMFRWYATAVRCYVYLPDVEVGTASHDLTGPTWESAFRNSRWFTRGWTLQELLAPASVEFFSREERLLGSKQTLERLVHEITQIPVRALRGAALSTFSDDERLRWTAERQTKRVEDKAYCLLGIFDVYMPTIYGEKDNAFKRLQEEIHKRSGEENDVLVSTRELTVPGSLPSVAPIHVHWTVTRSPNSLFTGREDILRGLGAAVREAVNNCTGHVQCRIVITGMGGQGKSEICLKLAHRFRHMFWGVFWVDVSTPSVAQTAFMDLARQLALPAQTWKEACLGVANLKHPWLLVLDNADDPEIDYQQYIPSGTLGVVMLTSRNDDCRQHATAKAVALAGLSEEEARELLLKAAGIPQDQCARVEGDVRRVARILQSHPLALIQAGAYVSRGHCTLGQYPGVYERQRQRLLGFRPVQAQSRYRDVYATFEASATALRTSSTDVARDALQLLPLLAACGASRLPLVWFEAGWKGAKAVPAEMEEDAPDEDVVQLTPWHVHRLPPLMDVNADRWDSYRLVEAVHLLKAFALVSTDTSDVSTSVSMHPLVHAWARDRQSNEEQHVSWLRMGCLAAFSRADEAFWRQNERQLQSHVEALAEWEMSTVFGTGPPVLLSRVVLNCGWLLHRIRSDAKLFGLMKKIFGRLGLQWEQVQRGWVGVYDLAGRNLVNHGQVREAVALLEIVVKIKEQTLGEEHPSRLASQHELARVYQANGQVREAVALLERVVKISEQTLGEEYPDRLASQHALAGAYEANGQVREAVALLERVVKIKEQTLAEDYPSRLASQHMLAGAYQVNGQVREAVGLLERVVKIREQTLGEEHPDRLASQHNLAIYLWELGDSQVAHGMMARVVRIREIVLDETHPDRQSSESWLEKFEERKLD